MIGPVGREPLPNLEKESSSCSAYGMIADGWFWVFGVSVLDSATEEVYVYTPREGKGVAYKTYMHAHHRTNKMGLSTTSMPTILPYLLNVSQASTLPSSRVPVVHVSEERSDPLYFKRLKGSLHRGGNTCLPIQNFKLGTGFSKMFRFAGRWNICQRNGAIKQFVASGMIINNNELQ